MRQRLADIWSHRVLLDKLVRRELRVRYKGSALGLGWSMLSPAMYLIVFSIVFTEILRVDVPRYGIFLLAGLIPWNVLSSSLTTGATSLTENRALVQKVWFPREVLPLAAVGSSLVNMLWQVLVLGFGMLVFRHAPDPRALVLLLLAVPALVLICSGLAVGLAALNVSYRDIKHLVDVTLTAWFWLTAVVYPYAGVSTRLGDNEWIAFANPMLAVVLTFQRVFYNPSAAANVHPQLDIGWYAVRLLSSLVLGAIILFVALVVFAREEPDFGDKL